MRAGSAGHGAWLVQLNPQPKPPPVWDHMLPEDLRAEPNRDFDMGGHVRDMLAEAGIALHSAWCFDVPERFSAADQLYTYLAWTRFHALGVMARPYAESKAALEAVMRRHAGPGGLEVRRGRFLWTARVD